MSSSVSKKKKKEKDSPALGPAVSPSSTPPSSPPALLTDPLAVPHPLAHHLPRGLVFVRQIGRGAHSVVLLAIERATKRQVAVKIVDKNHMGERRLGRLAREVRIHSLCSGHPHIARFISAMDNDSRFLILTDYMPGGDLHQYLCEQPKYRFTLPDAVRKFRQLVRAVHHVHSLGFVHRDLKLENIFLDIRGHVKLGDFGLASQWKPGHEMHSPVGTLFYASPELVRDRPSYYGPELDCWALGVILFTMLTGKLPFMGADAHDTRRYIMHGSFTLRVRQVGEEAAELIRGLLTVDRRKRMTIEECLRHPFLRGEESEESDESEDDEGSGDGSGSYGISLGGSSGSVGTGSPMYMKDSRESRERDSKERERERGGLPTSVPSSSPVAATLAGGSAQAQGRKGKLSTSNEAVLTQRSKLTVKSLNAALESPLPIVRSRVDPPRHTISERGGSASLTGGKPRHFHMDHPDDRLSSIGNNNDIALLSQQLRHGFDERLSGKEGSEDTLSQEMTSFEEDTKNVYVNLNTMSLWDKGDKGKEKDKEKEK